MTLWARARIEKNDQTSQLSDDQLKNQIKSVFENRLASAIQELLI